MDPTDQEIAAAFDLINCAIGSAMTAKIVGDYGLSILEEAQWDPARYEALRLEHDKLVEAAEKFAGILGGISHHG